MTRDNGHRFKFYILFIKANRSIYPEIFKFLKQRGYLKDKNDTLLDRTYQGRDL
jgi:hypothetical protein